MTKFDRASEESTGTDDRCIDARDARALAQYLTVLEDVGRARGAEDLYLVVSQSGKEYLVDLRDGVCECPDHEHRGVRCKHLRRVAFAMGETPIPDGVDVDPQLGAHVSASPRVAATDGGIIEAPDGGEILDESESDAADDGRPADCTCDEDDVDVACWACYREGFDFHLEQAEEFLVEFRDEIVRAKQAELEWETDTDPSAGVADPDPEECDS